MFCIDIIPQGDMVEEIGVSTHILEHLDRVKIVDA